MATEPAAGEGRVSRISRVRAIWDAKYIVAGAVVFVLAAAYSLNKGEDWAAKQWRRFDGAYACPVVLDPALSPGGILENQDQVAVEDANRLILRLPVEEIAAMETLADPTIVEALNRLGSVTRDGPTRGRLYLGIWDVKGPFPAAGNGSAHSVEIWLDDSRPDSTEADARVHWFEESRTVEGTLDELHGTIRINRAISSSPSRDGKSPFVIEYDLTGLKRYKGVATEMRTNNKVTMNF